MKTSIRKALVCFVVLTLLLGQAAPALAQENTPESPAPTPTETATPAMAETAVETPSATPTADGTEFPMETAANTPTPTESVTPVPPTTTSSQIVEIKLKATPDSLKAGGKINLHWEIVGLANNTAEGSNLKLILPDGFVPAQSEAGTFDSQTQSLWIPFTKTSGSIQIEAVTSATEDAIFYLALFDSSQAMLAINSIVIPLREHFEVGPNGGEFSARDGKIKVKFGEDALKGHQNGVDVEVGLPAGETLPYSLSGQPFEIKAWTKNDKAELKQFDEVVEFEFNLSDYGFEGAKSGEVYLHWYNPETGDWERMYSWVDEETSTLHGLTNHFSIFDIGANSQYATPRITDFQVANFTGAATYSLPIEVPSGPGGLQPNLALNYNSQVVDQSTDSSQTSWVGMGWSLDSGTIMPMSHVNGNDTWLLSLNGISAEIIQPNGSGMFYTANENFTKITFANKVWTIWDKQGNIYYFDYVITATYQTTNCGEITYVPYKWSLTRVQNVFGKQLTYAYTKETKNITYTYRNERGACKLTAQTPSDAASYPSTITYPDGRTRVRFVLEARSDYNLNHVADQVHASFERSRLNQIVIERDTDGNGTFETIMKMYDLTYSSDGNQVWPNIVKSAGGKVSTLVSVQEFGAGGSAALPAVTFTYGDNMHLTAANNGYGGGVIFEYGAWYYETKARASYTNSWSNWDNPLKISTPGMQGLPGMTNVPLMPGRAYLISANLTPLPVTLRLYDGYTYKDTPGGLSPKGIFVLAATANRAIGILNNDNPYDAYHDPSEWTTYLRISEFLGLTTIYRVTKRTFTDGRSNSYPYTYSYSGAAVNDPAHSAAVANNTSPQEAYSEFRGHAQVTETAPDGTQTVTSYYQDDIFRGVAYKTTTLYNGKKLSEEIYTYTNTVLSPQTYGSVVHLHNWTHLDAVENRLYNNDGTTYSATKETYGYETTYGNLTSKSESNWGGGVWNLYRTTVIDYYPNTTGYLVGYPARQQVKDAAGNVLAESLNLYDGASAYTTAPVSGKLSATRSLISAANYAQTSFGYDTFGNQTSQTTFTGYGTASSAPIVGAATTTTSYETTYNTYPISITIPLNQITSIAYDYSKGLPISETDPNNAVTSAGYDAFGRITSLTRAGDAGVSISKSYQDSFPFTVTLTLNATGYATTRQYDGMGREFYSNAGGVITDTVYQSATVTKQSLPHFANETAYYTTTSMDIGLRKTTITAPDGTSASTISNGLTTTQTDARGNSTTSISDIWGRVTNVTPPTGPAVAYSYDTLGQLLTVSRGGAATTLTYDNAGRKLSMSDPDMGNWSYTYDALGSLKTQTDARGCLLTMNYDLLNRLTNKSSSGSCGTQINTAYSYDAGVNGIGRRTSMTDASGSSSWLYDNRGRMIKEAKIISGQSFVTEWGYNSADLNTWIKYPDGEIVNQTYNARMMTETVASLSGTYASLIQYDSAGRITHLKRGNNTLDTAFAYNPWNTQGGRLDTLTTTRLSDQIQIQQQVDYSYDPTGNITSIFDLLSGETQSFGYDTLDRLTTASAVSGLANYTETYSYNATTGNLASKAGVTYTYDVTHKHAVSSLSNGNTYGYDANGNQITRVIGADTFTLTYDAENRLIEVKKNGTSIATFVYDGDGRRVKSVIGAETTLFAGSHYEVTDGTVTKYYFAGSQRIAMKTGTALTFLLSDHLGSTSLTTNSSGQVLSEMKYKAWGETRYTSGTTATKYQYTGQYSNMGDFGLMYYNARMYDPALGRFTSADSIVPAGVQGLDRYAYGLNNPSRYTDPSGHTPCEGKNYDDGPNCLKNKDSQLSLEVRNTKYQRDCAAGKNSACPGGAKRLVAFGVESVVTVGLLEYGLASGPIADAGESALWWLQKQTWKTGWGALRMCAGNPACLQLAIKLGIYYPNGNGFVGTPTPTTLEPGQFITRFGDETGSYASPIGTTLNQRALPFHMWNSPLNGYKVLKPIDVLSGPAQSYYGLEGGGIQYLFSKPIQFYIDNGYLSQPWP